MTVVMMKPTNECNVNGCTYCYNMTGYAASDSMLMETSIIRKAMRQITAYENAKKRYVEFEWIGGEPLIAGKQFFSEIIDITKELQSEGYHLSNCIQSNGTLMTKEWARMLLDADIPVSFSLDGLEEINNLTRKYACGIGTFKQIMRGITSYQSEGGKVGLICVVNRHNIDHLAEFYTFCNEIEVGLQLNYLSYRGNAKENRLDLAVSPQEYADALYNIFELWLTNPKKMHVESTINSIIQDTVRQMDNKYGSCSWVNMPCQSNKINNLISISPNGDVYPCTSLDGDEEFRLGNIKEEDYKDIVEGSLRTYLGKRNQRMLKKGISFPGCLHNAILANSEVDSVDPMVEAKLNLKEKIGKRLNELLISAKVI
ncbi:MAG: radical SAM protein [Candidatus Woesearchaeota archaeon]|nr:radical SAM protein [Candidatus Woesearchaeota archaeon]